MFLMNIFVRERKGIWMIVCVRESVRVYACAGENQRWNITVKIQVPLFIFVPLFTISRVWHSLNNMNHNILLLLFRANCTYNPLTNIC